jgi:hypothetical protein
LDTNKVYKIDSQYISPGKELLTKKIKKNAFIHYMQVNRGYNFASGVKMHLFSLPTALDPGTEHQS